MKAYFQPLFLIYILTISQFFLGLKPKLISILVKIMVKKNYLEASIYWTL